ncbi:MAG: Maf family protein [Sandaracinaceae bacterium]
MTLVLASASPRRREILETLGLAFEVQPSQAPEDPREGEGAVALATRLAGDKAREVSLSRPGAAVLGADTVVVLGAEALGKPADESEARAMISRLSGGWHEVTTGVALARDGALLESIAVSTRVRFATLSEARIARYAATGEGLDKAGAYAVQGIGAGLVERIEGSYSNVVGLPAHETLALLERHGALGEWP